MLSEFWTVTPSFFAISSAVFSGVVAFRGGDAVILQVHTAGGPESHFSHRAAIVHDAAAAVRHADLAQKRLRRRALALFAARDSIYAQTALAKLRVI